MTLVASMFVICPTSGKAQTQVDEYRVKAAFLFHFAQFVEWPPQPFGTANNSFALCIAGDDPFHGDLEETIQGKTIGARIVRIRHLSQIQEPRACDVLFINKDDRRNISQLMLRKTATLTVGESEDFLQQGGMIRLFIEDHKIRFEINREAAESANLKVSSRLLLLAKTVIGRR